jgi:hypothetical protein
LKGHEERFPSAKIGIVPAVIQFEEFSDGRHRLQSAVKEVTSFGIGAHGVPPGVMQLITTIVSGNKAARL